MRRSPRFAPSSWCCSGALASSPCRQARPSSLRCHDLKDPRQHLQAFGSCISVAAAVGSPPGLPASRQCPFLQGARTWQGVPGELTSAECLPVSGSLQQIRPDAWRGAGHAACVRMPPACTECLSKAHSRQRQRCLPVLEHQVLCRQGPSARRQ